MDALRTLLNEKLAEKAAGPKIAVEVTSRTFGAMGGVVIETGTHRYEVTESGLRELEDLTESDEGAVRAARKHYEEHRRKVLAEKKNDQPFMPSFEASFRLLNGRDVKPFDSVKRVDEGKSKRAA